MACAKFWSDLIILHWRAQCSLQRVDYELINPSWNGPIIFYILSQMMWTRSQPIRKDITYVTSSLIGQGFANLIWYIAQKMHLGYYQVWNLATLPTYTQEQKKKKNNNFMTLFVQRTQWHLPFVTVVIACCLKVDVEQIPTWKVLLDFERFW